ncbi:Kelch repeat-containing protein [Microbacterium lacusdiani]
MRTSRFLAAAACVLAVALVSGCASGPGSGVQRAGASIMMAAPSKPAMGMDAIITGTLTRLDGGCLGLTVGERETPLQFPFGSILADDGESVDVPGHGTVRIGDLILGGGGWVPIPDAPEECGVGAEGAMWESVLSALEREAIFQVPAVAAGWTQADDFPLEPREHAVTAWTGEELLVLGGYVGPPCPPTADCVMEGWAADGAALNPDSGTWRTLAPAPMELRVPDAAFAAGQVFVNVGTSEGSAVLVYDLAEDAWTELRDVPDLRSMMPVSDGERVLFVSPDDEHGERPDQAYDLDARSWSALPDDPFPSSFLRHAVSTPFGVVLSGVPISDVAESAPGFERLALLEPGAEAWRELPTTGSIHPEGWVWTGERLVDPALGGSDGGEADGFGEVLPYGVVVDLPGGVWSLLPDPPDAEAFSGWLHRVEGGRYAVADGYVFDDRQGTWTALPQPDGRPTTPGDAVWAGDRLVLLGGTDWGGEHGMDGTRSDAVWIYTPGG